jgi:hypothetical protein
MTLRADDAVWLSDGLPGIVIGLEHHGRVRVLWHTLRTTTIPASWIVHREPCPRGLTAPMLWRPV